MNTFFFTVAKMQETSLTLDDGCKYLSNLNVMTDIKNSRNINYNISSKEILCMEFLILLLAV